MRRLGTLIDIIIRNVVAGSVDIIDVSDISDYAAVDIPKHTESFRFFHFNNNIFWRASVYAME